MLSRQQHHINQTEILANFTCGDLIYGVGCIRDNLINLPEYKALGINTIDIFNNYCISLMMQEITKLYREKVGFNKSLTKQKLQHKITSFVTSMASNNSDISAIKKKWIAQIPILQTNANLGNMVTKMGTDGVVRVVPSWNNKHSEILNTLIEYIVTPECLSRILASSILDRTISDLNPVSINMLCKIGVEHRILFGHKVHFILGAIEIEDALVTKTNPNYYYCGLIASPSVAYTELNAVLKFLQKYPEHRDKVIFYNADGTKIIRPDFRLLNKLLEQHKAYKHELLDNNAIRSRELLRKIIPMDEAIKKITVPAEATTTILNYAKIHTAIKTKDQSKDAIDMIVGFELEMHVIENCKIKYPDVVAPLTIMDEINTNALALYVNALAEEFTEICKRRHNIKVKSYSDLLTPDFFTKCIGREGNVEAFQLANRINVYQKIIAKMQASQPLNENDKYLLVDLINRMTLGTADLSALMARLNQLYQATPYIKPIIAATSPATNSATETHTDASSTFAIGASGGGDRSLVVAPQPPEGEKRGVWGSLLYYSGLTWVSGLLQWACSALWPAAAPTADLPPLTNESTVQAGSALGSEVPLYNDFINKPRGLTPSNLIVAILKKCHKI